MKYTKSRDGVERTTVILKLRFTRQEMDGLRSIARRRGETIHEVLMARYDEGKEDEAARGEEEE